MSRRRRALATYILLLLGGGLVAALSSAPGRGGRAIGPTTTTVPGTPSTALPETTIETVEGPAPLAWRPLGEPGVGGQITALAISPYDGRRFLAAGDVLGVALSEDGGDSWESTSGFASWEAAEFTFHPSRSQEVWVGTMSGPYVSTDGGHQWTARRDGFPPVAPQSYSAPVERVLFDPQDEAHLLAFGGSHRRFTSPGRPAWGAVWESTDGGLTWSRKSTLADGTNIVSATFVDSTGSTLVAAVDEGGVYRSTDKGATWTRSAAGLPSSNVRSLASDPATATVWAAIGADGTTPGGVWRSTDGATTWQDANVGLDRRSDNPDVTSSFEVVAVSASTPPTVYTADRSFRYGTIYRSDDGVTWTRLLDPKSTLGGPWKSPASADAIAVDPSDPGVVIAGQQEWIARSRDAGASWTDASSRVVPGGWVGRGFGGLVTTRVAFSGARPGQFVLTGMDGGNPLVSSDGGQSYQRPTLDYDGYNGASDAAIGGPDGSTIGVQLGQRNVFNGIARSTDAGVTWSVAEGTDAGLPARGAAQPPGSMAVAAGSETMWATVGGKLYRSVDGGATWRVLRAPNSAGDIAVDPRDDLHLYIAAADAVYESPDGGDTFTPVPGSPAQTTRLVVDRATPSVVYAIAWRALEGGLFRFDGQSWLRVRDDGFIYDVAVDPFHPTRLVAVTNDHPFHDESSATGVWVSDDDGASWTQANGGLAQLRVATIAFDPHTPNRVIIGTYGRGFFVSGPA